MASYGELRPILSEMARYLRILSTNSCESSSNLPPLAGTSADDPVSIPSGYTNLVVTKTNGTGTVTITFPDASTYVLSASGEVFEIAGNPQLGNYVIALASGATYKFYAY